MSMSQDEINVGLFDEVKKLQQEIRELEAWKESAMQVIGEWEKVWEAAGRPGRLGASKAASVLAFLANDESSDLRPVGVPKSEQREPQVRCDDWLGDLRAIAAGECACTPAQETGEDPTVCRRCAAAGAINAAAEAASDYMKTESPSD